MNKHTHSAVMAVILAGGFILLAGFASAPQSSFATHDEDEPLGADSFSSKLRAIQDGNVIRIDEDVDGLAGLPVDCVGGVEQIANATTMKCYLLTGFPFVGDNGTWASDFKSDPAAIVQEGSPVACPEDAGFESDKQCFLTTFDGSNFDSQGNYRFVAEFYSGDEVVDVVTHDYRLMTFFALPESAIGAVALLGSSLAVFGVYRVMTNRKQDGKAA